MRLPVRTLALLLVCVPVPLAGQQTAPVAAYRADADRLIDAAREVRPVDSRRRRVEVLPRIPEQLSTRIESRKIRVRSEGSLVRALLSMSRRAENKSVPFLSVIAPRALNNNRGLPVYVIKDRLGRE